MATKKIAGRKRAGTKAQPRARGSTPKSGGPAPRTGVAGASSGKRAKPNAAKSKITRLMRKFERDLKEKPDFHMSVSDYLRLLQVKRDLEDQPASVEVTWVETPDEPGGG